MGERPKHHATGRTEVKTYAATIWDEVAGAPALVEVQLTEAFTGDIEGEGTARVMQAARPDGGATFTGIERVRGSIAGRRGTFLLQVRGTVAGQEMHADWFVIEGSGTEALAGLSGDGGFRAELGRQGTVWLDCLFE
ncbi:MAG TPA: DUF3224 domain-containing protein [Polyangia bacterium]|jgi:hypothetical protein